MITSVIAFADFSVVFDTFYKGRVNRHVVVDRSTNLPQADFSTYEEAFNFAVFLQEPITANTPPDRYIRKKVNQVGSYLIIRTVRKRSFGSLDWTYLVTDKYGVKTLETASNYKDAFSCAVKLAIRDRL